MKSGLDPKRMVAPCGNVTWRQCSKACTKDIWNLERFLMISALIVENR